MKQAHATELRAEFLRAAIPFFVCIATITIVVVVAPLVSTLQHAYARREAQQSGGHIGIAQMNDTERDALFVHYRIKMLANSYAQIQTLDRRVEVAHGLAEKNPTPMNAEQVKRWETSRQLVVNNYNVIAAKLPSDAFAHSNLPRQID